MSPYSLIKLSATTSTNTYLKDLSRTTKLNDATVVVTSNQSKGRGQQGATWFSQTNKSLTCSIYKVFESINVKDYFYISMAVAVGIAEILQSLQVPDVEVKWPNDIMSRGKKCGGILIENILQRDAIKASIIGVGLNINNRDIPNLPNATSMKLACGQHFNISEVMDKVVDNIIEKLKGVNQSQFKTLHQEYHQLLFMRKKVQVFEDLQHNKFNAIIKGVTNSGLLELILENDEIKTYQLKQVRFCF